MPDHVRLFIAADPTRSVAEIVNRFKGRTSRLRRDEFKSLRSRLSTLWSRSYFAATVGCRLRGHDQALYRSAEGRLIEGCTMRRPRGPMVLPFRATGAASPRRAAFAPGDSALPAPKLFGGALRPVWPLLGLPRLGLARSICSRHLRPRRCAAECGIVIALSSFIRCIAGCRCGACRAPPCGSIASVQRIRSTIPPARWRDLTLLWRVVALNG